ncbi:MAG: AMP-binding protein, partial [Candidatus Hodarchaeota archaeon]
KDIQKFKATFTVYVGEIPHYLLNQPISKNEKNHTLKKILGVGLRKEIWKEFKSRFQIENIFEFYGLTEGHRALFNADEIPGMVGRLTQSGLVLAKIDPETGEFYKDEKGYCLKCKKGDVGMALIKLDKDTFFTGYKDKDKTQNRLISNVFRKDDIYFNTGDILNLHDNRWVSFADRFGDSFRWKGENVSTLEVEEILNSYPAILMSAVYGVAIPNTEGKAGMAAIKLKSSRKFDVDDFSRFVAEVLPIYSTPVFIRIKDELKITGPLKIKKTKIRKEAYDLELFRDPLLIRDLKTKKYIPFTKELYQDLINGKLNI